MYAVLAEKGFINHEDLHSYRVLGGICQGHVDMKWCPGVDFSAGSLGMGLSFGMGCAAARLDKSNRQAYVMLGDEIQEGSIWETAMAARHHELGNLNVILDRNRIQNDDFVKLKCVCLIFLQNGLHLADVMEIDGHDAEIFSGLEFLPRNVLSLQS